MQACFETGNDKLYMQIKNKIIYCPHKFTAGTPISAKQAQVVADFAVPALNVILIKSLVESISHQKKKKTTTNKQTNKQTEFSTTNEKLYENWKFVKLNEKQDGDTD